MVIFFHYTYKKYIIQQIAWELVSTLVSECRTSHGTAPLKQLVLRVMLMDPAVTLW